MPGKRYETKQVYRKIRSDFDGGSEIDRIMREMECLSDQIKEVKEILGNKNKDELD